MLFLEGQARFWLVVHLGLGVSLTAAATHQALWMRGYLAGRFGRHRAARRFAWIVLGLYAANFLVGNLIYPVYKVRVRVEYLDNPAVLVAEQRVRRQLRAAGADPAVAAAGRSGEPLARHADDSNFVASERLVAVGRLFDIKEHWIALGFILAIAGAGLMQAWNPRHHGNALARPALGLAVAVAVTTWAVSIIGAVVTSYRAVGS